LYLGSAVAEDHDNVRNAAGVKVVDATLNNCGFAEREEGLERAHATRLAGGKKDGDDGVVGLGFLVFGLSH
jgi:hypothetical protein